MCLVVLGLVVVLWEIQQKLDSLNTARKRKDYNHKYNNKRDFMCGACCCSIVVCILGMIGFLGRFGVVFVCVCLVVVFVLVVLLWEGDIEKHFRFPKDKTANKRDTTTATTTNMISFGGFVVHSLFVLFCFVLFCFVCF